MPPLEPDRIARRRTKHETLLEMVEIGRHRQIYEGEKKSLARGWFIFSLFSCVFFIPWRRQYGPFLPLQSPLLWSGSLIYQIFLILTFRIF